MHKNGKLIYLIPQERSSKKNGHKHLYLSTEDLCPRTFLILVVGAEEEDVEQEDMAYTAGSFSLR